MVMCVLNCFFLCVDINFVTVESLKSKGMLLYSHFWHIE